MAAQQLSVVLPVRALDGRATSVRLPATASVRDLKAALRVCFPPAQAAPAFHLFLLGGKLLLDAKLANLSLARGEFVSLIPFTAKPAAPPTASANPNPRAGPSVFPAAKRSKFSSSSMWRGEDVYAKIARVPVHDPASPSFYCHGVEPLDLLGWWSTSSRGSGSTARSSTSRRSPTARRPFARSRLTSHNPPGRRSRPSE